MMILALDGTVSISNRLLRDLYVSDATNRAAFRIDC